MFARFGLTLVVNHACNLRCSYCYTGLKFRRPMPVGVARLALRRALHSLAPQGTLELGFFGGEPLLEAELIAGLMDEASTLVAFSGQQVEFSLTSNGTFTDGAAWNVLTDPRLRLFISHDGLPEIHDRHRVSADGRGSSATVLRTIARLQDAGKDFGCIVVVRPDSVAHLPDGIEYLRDRGVRQFVPSLDLWTEWTTEDAANLRSSIARCADLWSGWLPEVAISWFDERTIRLLRVPCNATARCGFGAGEIAVAPSGRLYPCERLVGEDDPHSPMRLPGDVADGADFLSMPAPPPVLPAAGSDCALAAACSTACRCSNYVRTSDVSRPDELLQLLDACCLQETVRALRSRIATGGEVFDALVSSLPLVSI